MFKYNLMFEVHPRIVKVFNALKDDNTKGNFIYLTNKDRQALEIELIDKDIPNTPKIT